MSKDQRDAISAQRIEILRYWHNIEFFIPFDLQGQVLEDRNADTNVRTFSSSKLDRADARALWHFTPASGKELVGLTVYLGVFDKRELAEVTGRVVAQALTPDEQVAQDERSELEGLTCFAAINVNKHGEPLLDNVSVSTAPWAMGRIEQHGLAGLDFDLFQDSLETLKEALSDFTAARSAQRSIVCTTDEDGEQDLPPVCPLDAADLLALQGIIEAWAGYRPAMARPGSPLLVIRARFGEIRKKPQADVDEDEREAATAEETDISILNSFYAQDIARVIVSLEQGASMPAIEAYLTPLPAAERVDLYQPAGRAQIAAALKPACLPRGHWLDNPAHAMSLMQQFAINTVFEKLATSGVFSVNGPPGTGKTTLLRDIFADNIVQRARALAAFDCADQAFLPEKIRINFRGAPDSCDISQLRPELGGFEMVVASSNNAAVENISRDLPKTKSLGANGWRDAHGRAALGYLQPIAHNLAARNAQGGYDQLAVEDVPWGLISCALGKSGNRYAFVGGLIQAGPKPPARFAKGYDEKKHQSLWHWRSKHKGISYAQARKNFLDMDDEVGTLIAQLDRYATVYADMQGQTLASFTAPERVAQDKALQESSLVGAAVSAADEEWQLCVAQLALLATDEARIRQTIPGWWARLRKTAEFVEYKAKMAANREQQAIWLHRQYAVEEPLHDARKAAQRAAASLSTARQHLAAREAQWSEKQQQFEQLAMQFPQAARPARLDDLENDIWQIGGLWRDELLNTKRAALFAAALQLQQAWLLEVIQTGKGFAANVIAICHMLSGKRLAQAEHGLAIWRSLFMVVPVVSTTLASFANQFRYLGANQIGWVFIDEAGQAVPQAAVGALWRARRAVVVGDPKQIEPVFTVPIKLIEALARTANLPPGHDVAPHRTSVQNLVDAANRLGTSIMSSQMPQWIGSPLRVHRRCVEPMFSIANEIAYDNKMVFYDPVDPARRLPPKDSLDLGNSAWVDVPGATDSKQSVPAQITLVLQALVALYSRTGALPPLYIVSPFKRIKDALTDHIACIENWEALTAASADVPKKTRLNEWCKARIGTVHTFQGKEESIVWMVLGCDSATEGAANWAADKPNILNVALTRARHRFFMIGDATLWGGKRHFDKADAGVLPRICADEFLRRVGGPRHDEAAASDHHQ